jgi:hypothetical protein
VTIKTYDEFNKDGLSTRPWFAIRYARIATRKILVEADLGYQRQSSIQAMPLVFNELLARSQVRKHPDIEPDLSPISFR